MKHTTILGIFLLFVSAAGCLPDTSGEPPPSDQLIFPVGVVTTAGDEYLLVANSNFDLQYNAGTMAAISLDKLEEIQKRDVSDIPEEWKSPTGEFLWVPESELITPEDTIRLDAFASDLELTPNKKRALIPIRGGKERHILVVDVDPKAEPGRVLSCGQGEDLQCDSAHRVTSNDTVTLPIEPYEVTSIDYEHPIPNPDGDKEVMVTDTLGFATHLYSGSVSAFLIENNQGKLDARLLDVVNDVVKEASGIASNPANGEIYVTGRENDEQYMAILRVLSGGLGSTNKPFFGMVDKVSYAQDLLGGTDARGIAVSSSGDDALVVSRSPEALLRFDTKTRKLADLTTLGTDPSVVSIYEDEDNAYAFVLCFKSNQLYIVEPEMMQVYVRSMGSGPHAIAFDKTRKWVYVANFRESTISVIHATPPFDFVRIADGTRLMIGKPRLPEDHN